MEQELVRAVARGGSKLTRAATTAVLEQWQQRGNPAGRLPDRVWWLTPFPNGASEVCVRLLPALTDVWCPACSACSSLTALRMQHWWAVTQLRCPACGALVLEV